MKIVIRVLLGIAVVFMAYLCVNSVVTPIRFEEARVQREVKVINNLVSLRTAEAQFRLDKGYFTADLDSLIDYLKTTPKKEVYKVGSLTEKQLEDGMTENKAAKILERARLKAQRKMKFQGTDSLDLLYNYIWEKDREVKAEGLQGFRRDTILTNMIQSLYKGQYTEETIGENGVTTEPLQMVSFYFAIFFPNIVIKEIQTICTLEFHLTLCFQACTLQNLSSFVLGHAIFHLLLGQ